MNILILHDEASAAKAVASQGYWRRDGNFVETLLFENTEAWHRMALLFALDLHPSVVCVAEGTKDADLPRVAQELAHACAAPLWMLPSWSPNDDFTRSEHGIPRALHFIWIGERPAPEKCVATWRAHHPGFVTTLWREDALRAVLGPELVARALALPERCGGSDLLRYELLARLGGVFLDTDEECLAPLPEALFGYHAFACSEHETALPGLIANGILGCTKGSMLAKELARRVRATPLADLLTQRAWQTTGPRLFTDTVTQRSRRARTPLARLPSRMLLGAHHSGAPAHGLWPVYARQHWASTRGAHPDAGLVAARPSPIVGEILPAGSVTGGAPREPALVTAGIVRAGSPFAAWLQKNGG